MTTDKLELRASLDRLRDTVRWKVSGLDDAQLRAPATPGGLSVLGLVKHLAVVEYAWFRLSFGRPCEALPLDPEDETRDMTVEPGESTPDILAFADRARAAADDTITELDLDAIGTRWSGEEVTLRWVMVHLIEETARHLGHLDLMRESLDGQTGDYPEHLEP